MRTTALLFLLVTICLAQTGQPPLLAPTPPMGWNSWDSFGLTVTQDEFQANAQYLADHLRPLGWQYAVVDEGWYLENPEAKPGSFHFSLDAYGRFTPAENRFPLAANGAGFSKPAVWAKTPNRSVVGSYPLGLAGAGVETNSPLA